MPFSPQREYAGAAGGVLLTGGLGYLGSVVLEQLLRLTEVPRVFVLARSKRGVPASKRLEKLLCGPLFNMLHGEAAQGKRSVFGRVQVVEGDLTLPGLGLSAADLALLRASVGTILHSGASIELDADVQTTLRNNYLGTAELLAFASSCEGMRAFVHVSTYFVNNHLPRNSTVKEAIYPLPLELGGQPVSHREYVAAMLAMPAEQANRVTVQLMDQLGFTSTYAFGKHLTEQLVDATCVRPGVSRAIVRPSLIASVAGDPYPGYISGYAGAAGYTMGYALGFFQGVKSVAYGSDTFLDLIPADTVAALVIAAGAAACATFGSSSADKRAVIFHAASAESHPLSIGGAFDRMSRFWKANPPPLCLPATSYVRIKGKHEPTQQGIDAGRRQAKFKIKLVGGLLRLSGKEREVRALKTGFKAFSVHNSLAYGKSFVCSVANARALQAQLLPSERALWPVVWSEEVQTWDAYGATFQAGVRRLLFRMDMAVRKLDHSFRYRESVAVEALQLEQSTPAAPSEGSVEASPSSSTYEAAAPGSPAAAAAVAAAAAAVLVQGLLPAAAAAASAAGDEAAPRKQEAAESPEEAASQQLLKAVAVA